MKIKKISAFDLSFLLTAGGFADNLVLENLTSYPQKNQK